MSTAELISITVCPSSISATGGLPLLLASPTEILKRQQSKLQLNVLFPVKKHYNIRTQTQNKVIYIYKSINLIKMIKQSVCMCLVLTSTAVYPE